MVLPSLSELSSAALVSSIESLHVRQRSDEVKLLWLLGELQARKGYLALGYDSLWAYCRGALRLSNGAAGRRTAAAAILREYPAAADFLCDGRLSLTTLGKLRPVLTGENHLSLFKAASLKTEDEVELIVRTIDPRPLGRETVIRPLRAEVVLLGPAPSAEVSVPATSPSGAAPEAASSSDTGEAQRAVVLAPTPVTIRVLDGEFVSLTIRAPREFLAELEQVTAALSHVVPSRKPVDVIRECVRRTLRDVEKRRGGLPARLFTSAPPEREGFTPGPGVGFVNSSGVSSNETDATDSTLPPTESREDATADPSGGSGDQSADPRSIPAPVRRAVWARDGGRCAFESAEGRRCGSTHQLELHHLDAAARGGPPTIANLTLRCRPHNVYAAQQDFGAEFMSQFTRRQ